MEFRDLMSSSPVEANDQAEEARFSFLKGGYVEDVAQQGMPLTSGLRLCSKHDLFWRFTILNVV